MTTSAEKINPARALDNLLRLTADSLENGEHGTRVEVNARDLAALLREAGYHYADMADRGAAEPGDPAGMGGTDAAVRIAEDIADRPAVYVWPAGPTPLSPQ
jgi:hypothetical protein